MRAPPTPEISFEFLKNPFAFDKKSANPRPRIRRRLTLRRTVVRLGIYVQGMQVRQKIFEITKSPSLMPARSEASPVALDTVVVAVASVLLVDIAARLLHARGRGANANIANAQQPAQRKLTTDC